MIRAVITILLVVATVPVRAALNPQDNVSAAEITADNFPWITEAPTASGADLVPRPDAYRPHWLNGMGLTCVRRSTLFVCRK
jgi:hypothetical protein